MQTELERQQNLCAMKKACMTFYCLIVQQQCIFYMQLNKR